MRPIDADAFKENMERKYGYRARQPQDDIDAQPTIDVMPAIHAYWIRWDSSQSDKCSSCHASTDRALMCTYGIPSTRYEQHPYCPWCGAKMTGDFIYDLEKKEGEQQ